VFSSHSFHIGSSPPLFFLHAHRSSNRELLVFSENNALLVARAIAAAQTAKMSVKSNSFVSNSCRKRCSVLRIWDIEMVFCEGYL
jgi:hypothetical protein